MRMIAIKRTLLIFLCSAFILLPAVYNSFAIEQFYQIKYKEYKNFKYSGKTWIKNLILYERGKFYLKHNDIHYIHPKVSWGRWSFVDSSHIYLQSNFNYLENLTEIQQQVNYSFIYVNDTININSVKRLFSQLNYKTENSYQKYEKIKDTTLITPIVFEGRKLAQVCNVQKHEGYCKVIWRVKNNFFLVDSIQKCIVNKNQLLHFGDTIGFD